MTARRNRRALLRTGALAVSAGLAGCVGGLGDEADDASDSTTETRTSPTRDTTRTTEAESTTAEPPLAVVDVRVQSSFVHLTTPDSADVSAPEGTQFVFADVQQTESGASAPPKDAFALVADDRRFDGTLVPGSAGSPSRLYWQGPAYDPDERETGWIAFEIPERLDADEVVLTYESEGRTFSESLDSEVSESLAEPPAEFELIDFGHPESVERYGRFELSVTVENVGEGDGVFRAALNQTHPLYAPHVVERRIPAGERGEWDRASSWSLHRDAKQAQFELLTPREKREATVEIATETTDDA